MIDGSDGRPVSRWVQFLLLSVTIPFFLSMYVYHAARGEYPMASLYLSSALYSILRAAVYYTQPRP